ncbi:MAG: lysine biosynthesis protein LysW [Patescibacteria group bacterium]|nr:lysine biosynthesis protein LysW [Patescibacteria group bacterium]MBU1876772.1 lysine biosynthesis protein LysW [Patescibacteria group bacterium]
MVKCLECGTDLNIPEEPMIGEIINCPSCGIDYEVKKIKEDGSLEIDNLEVISEDFGE